MRQIAATRRSDKSPRLHCCCDKSLVLSLSLRYVARIQTSFSTYAECYTRSAIGRIAFFTRERKAQKNYICKVYYLKFLFHISKQSSCACQPDTHGKPGSPAGIPGRDGRIDRTEITGPAEAPVRTYDPGLQGTKGETGIQGRNGHKKGAW